MKEQMPVSGPYCESPPQLILQYLQRSVFPLQLLLCCSLDLQSYRRFVWVKLLSLIQNYTEIRAIKIIITHLHIFIEVMFLANTADKLYSYLTKLDFYRDFGTKSEDAQRNIEKDNLDMQPELERQQSMDNVPLTFPSTATYLEMWKKLFFIEAKAQVVKQKQEDNNPPQLTKIISLDLIEKFYHLNLLKPMGKVSYGPSSLVMVYLEKPPRIDKKNKFKQEEMPKPLHILCVVEQSEALKLKFVNGEGIHGKVEKLKQLTEVYVQKLCLISTIQRQFRALEQFPSIILRDILLKPDAFKNISEDRFTIPEKLDMKLHDLYNQSQYRAIHESLKKEGITLIQGPPGTGKTKTVIGTISVLLNSINHADEMEDLKPIPKQPLNREKYFKKNPWLRSDYVDWRDEIDTEESFVPTKNYVKADITDKQIILKKKQSGIQLPKQILICGPSNASVDEIIRKILLQGLINEKQMSLVRIGDGFDPTLEHVTLDKLAEKYFNDLKSSNRKQDITFCKKKILKDSSLVCGTLSSAGHPLIKDCGLVFDTVIIDQACQAVEISTLIPLSYGCKRLILIGDPNQLPSTVFSIKSIKHGYDQSLFERMMKVGYPVNLLKTQYRMHPEISRVVGQNFYEGLLNNNPIIDRTLLPQIEEFGAFIFFHIEGSSEINFKRSYRNRVEAEAIKDLIKFLVNRKCEDIGVLSPYSQQISLLESMNSKKDCEIKTIDSFQGRQKSIVIFNTVRASLAGEKAHKNHKKTIGFLKDKRRVNVGLSRAKKCCIVVGDATRLGEFEVWSEIVQMALERKQLFNYVREKGYFEGFRANKLKYLRENIK